MPRELGEEILHYPHQGDQRSVRPLIRASEGSLGFTSVKPIPIDLDSRKSMPNEPPEIEKSQWPAQFWEQCFQDTGCWELEMGISEERSEKTTNLARIKEVYAILVRHSLETTRTTAVDAKHDATFGFAFYTLALLEELLRPGNRYSIGGRNTLRTLAECYITFAYLLHVDDETSWMTYRNYGAGQAKLSLLKFEEADDAPPSVDMRVLDQLANEDAWQEFVSIDLGHWQKLNLRKMSEAAGVKEDYDKYYPWPSHYAHGHWGAVRDTVYATCGNPLHRLHRVARDLPRQLPSVLPDACELVDKILDLVDGAYPRFQARVTVVAHS